MNHERTTAPAEGKAEFQDLRISKHFSSFQTCRHKQAINPCSVEADPMQGLKCLPFSCVFLFVQTHQRPGYMILCNKINTYTQQKKINRQDTFTYHTQWSNNKLTNFQFYILDKCVCICIGLCIIIINVAANGVVINHVHPSAKLSSLPEKANTGLGSNL